MSRIVHGISVPNDEANKPFGYLAIFSDGDIRKHTTVYPKTHCVRVTMPKRFRWQTVTGGILHNYKSKACPATGITYYLVELGAEGYKTYEWFRNEGEACRVASKAVELTNDDMYREISSGGKSVHIFNAEFLGQPYYAQVEIVPARTVWAHADKVYSMERLRKAENPRLVVGSEAMPDVRALLIERAATFTAAFEPEVVPHSP